MNCKWVSFSIFFLYFVGCGTANIVTINGTVTDNSGTGLSEVQISFGPAECCSDNGTDCLANTDASGKWTFVMNTGAANQDADIKRIQCDYSASKSGFTTFSGTFEYCIRGSCAGENQTVTVNTVLSP